MTFINLSGELQELLLVQFGFFVKFLLFITLLIISLSYIFYFSPNQKPTAWYSVMISRIILYAFSITFLFMSPLALLTLSPDYELISFLSAFYPLYLTIIIIIAIALIVDFFYYFPTIILKIGGIDINDPKVSRAYKKVKKFMKNNG